MAELMFQMDELEGKSWENLCDSDDDDFVFDEVKQSCCEGESFSDEEVKVNWGSIYGDTVTPNIRRQHWNSGGQKAAMRNQDPDGWKTATKHIPKYMHYIPKNIYHIPPNKRKEFVTIQKEHGDVSKAARTMAEGAGAALERKGWIPRRVNTIITEQVYKKEMQRGVGKFKYVKVDNDWDTNHYIVYQRRPKPTAQSVCPPTMLSTNSFAALRDESLLCD